MHGNKRALRENQRDSKITNALPTSIIRYTYRPMLTVPSASDESWDSERRTKSESRSSYPPNIFEEWARGKIKSRLNLGQYRTVKPRILSTLDAVALFVNICISNTTLILPWITFLFSRCNFGPILWCKSALRLWTRTFLSTHTQKKSRPFSWLCSIRKGFTVGSHFFSPVHRLMKTVHAIRSPN